uniref:Uncharacterized protein n=1 Tax=Anopheles atroparvus TaxID=41427 RepID=A0A182IQD1_ANOAO
MLGGKGELRVEQQARVHGGGGGRIVQQGQVRRRIEPVRVQVGQQVRRRVDRRPDRDVRRRDVPALLDDSFGLPEVGRKAPVLPDTLSEQFESLPSRSFSSDCSLLRIASSARCTSSNGLCGGPTTSSSLSSSSSADMLLVRWSKPAGPREELTELGLSLSPSPLRCPISDCLKAEQLKPVLVRGSRSGVLEAEHPIFRAVRINQSGRKSRCWVARYGAVATMGTPTSGKLAALGPMQSIRKVNITAPAVVRLTALLFLASENGSPRSITPLMRVAFISQWPILIPFAIRPGAKEKVVQPDASPNPPRAFVPSVSERTVRDIYFGAPCLPLASAGHSNRFRLQMRAATGATRHNHIEPHAAR